MRVQELINILETLNPEVKISAAGLNRVGYQIDYIEIDYYNGNHYCIMTKEDNY